MTAACVLAMLTEFTPAISLRMHVSDKDQTPAPITSSSTVSVKPTKVSQLNETETSSAPSAIGNRAQPSKAIRPEPCDRIEARNAIAADAPSTPKGPSGSNASRRS